MGYVKYIASLPKVAWLKIRYAGKMVIPWKQRIGSNFSVSIMRKGKIRFNGVLHCRKNCCLISDGGNLSLGNGVFMNQNSMITCVDEISIGNNVKIGNNAVIVDHDHNYREAAGSDYLKSSISIGQNTWIGANAIILRGAHIGEACVVAAGTVVRAGEYPDHSLIYNKRELVVTDYDKIKPERE